MVLWGTVNSTTEIGDTPVKNLFNESAAPTVNDDSTADFSPGSIWVDTTNDDIYICTDSSVGAANWEQQNNGGGGSATKEMFYADLIGTKNSNGSFAGRSVSSGGDHCFTWFVPHDYSSTTSIELLCIPNGTNATADIDLNSDYGAAGEAHNTHSESNTSITFNLVQDDIIAMDVSSVYSSLTASDYCGLDVDHNTIGFTNMYIGIRFRYT